MIPFYSLNAYKRHGKAGVACVALLLFFALLFSSCAAPAATEPPAFTPAAASPTPLSTPAPTPMPTPWDGKVRLDPEEFLSLLFEKRHDASKTKDDTFEVGCEDIAAILRAHNEPALSALLLENAGSYHAMQTNTSTLFYKGAYETESGQTEYAAVVLNNFRFAYCLLFEKGDEWLLTDYFPCAEVGYMDDLTLGEQTATDALYGKQTWLVVPGVVETGSAFVTESCIWYNLGAHTIDVGYTPYMHSYQGSHPLQYRMEGTLKLDTTPEGRLCFTVQNDYVFGNDAYFSNDEREGKKTAVIKRSETQKQVFEPGEPFMPKSYGRFSDSPAYAFSVRDLFDICPSQLDALRQKGNAAQKAWVDALYVEGDHERNGRITVHALGSEILSVGRYAGYAPVPRIDDFLDLNPTFTVQPGAEFDLGFDFWMYPYTLTRYDTETKEGTPVTTLNHRFFAADEEATYLYTLEYYTYGGLNSYDFLIVTSKDAPLGYEDEYEPPAAWADVQNALPQNDVILLGLEHIEKITGYSVKDKPHNVSAELRKSNGPAPDAWELTYSLHDVPQLQFSLSCAAQTGNIMYFSCTYKEQIWNGLAALSFITPPPDTENMDMKELALYYYDLLPVDDQGELKRVEYRRDVKGKDGSTLAQIYVRFTSDNVFAIDFDKALRRPVWICMYYK